VLPLLYLHGLSSKDFIPAREQLLAVFGFPAEHWIRLKTSNPIESTFATVRLRTKVTKGPGSRAAGLAMVFKLIEAASGPVRGRLVSYA
jgi:transposase-like protein